MLDEKAIPTMAGLARQFYSANPDLKVDSRNKAADLFPTNLEALINYLVSLGNILPDNKKKSEQQKSQSLNKFIFGKYAMHPYALRYQSLYKEFYIRIIKKTRQVPINIYTTNYDLYNENALHELGFMYNNGFLGSTQRIFRY